MSLHILFSTFSFFFSFIYGSDIECPSVNNSTTKDRRKDKTKLRLVQYNVEWLFLDYYQPMDCPGDGCTWKTQSDAQTHLKYVSSVIQYLNPDIINICEVEGCDELNAVISNLDTSYIPYLKKGTDTATGQNVGMLTRIDPLISLYRTEEKYSYPIPDSRCGNTSVTGSTGVSKHYITEYRFDEFDVAFIAGHLLAGPTDPTRCVEREAQSQILQNVIYGYIQKGYEIIFLGDLNDFDAEVLDIGPNYPTSRVLDILKGKDGEKKGKYELINLATHLTPPERYSDWWDSDKNCNTSSISDYSMIDHVLVTEELNKHVVDMFIYHGYDEYCDKWNSDHYPVVIDFAL